MNYNALITCLIILNTRIPIHGEEVTENATSTQDLVEEVASVILKDLEPSRVEAVSENVAAKEGFQSVFLESSVQNSGIENDLSATDTPVIITLSDLSTSELTTPSVPPSSQTSNQSTSQIEEIFTEFNQSTTISKDNLTEQIPSFSEWTQKQLEEAEKNKSIQHNTNNHTNNNGKATKIRWKNYASGDCGAKVVASNPEAKSVSALLSPSRDEYKLNECTGRIWFIVELCEAIQAKKIDLANFELFSSSPKDFVVSVSDRFPTRDWTSVGQFVARDEKVVQSFDLHPHLFGKYIKVEIKSHYGSEHFCPISSFAVYGTSEFEVLQKEESITSEVDDEDDDDDSLDSNDKVKSKDILSSATDAVISIVKKAAEVLVKGNHSNSTDSLSNGTNRGVPLMRVCTCPSHLIMCQECSDELFGQVYELISCEYRKIQQLIKSAFILNVLKTSDICTKFGFNFTQISNGFSTIKNYKHIMLPTSEMCSIFDNKLTQSSRTISKNYLRTMLPESIIGAMCNLIGLQQNQIILNTSHHINKTLEDVTIISSETLRIVPTSTITKEIEKSLSDTVTMPTTSTVRILPTKTEELREDTTVPIDLIVEPELEPEFELPENGTESIESFDEIFENLKPQTQKESVFLRLSNRIKALERNMSLSGQYLEELSKRYKQQVEEIQKLLDKTLATMSAKDELNKQLDERVTQLTQSVDQLIAEKRSWYSTIYSMVVSSLVTLILVTFCTKLPEPDATKHPELKRKQSVEATQPQKKRRRPSDQALKIVRSSTERNDLGRRTHKRKRKLMLKRSNSIGAVNEEKRGGDDGWVQHEEVWVKKGFVEAPIALEESEHSYIAPVGAPEFATTAVSVRNKRMNGEGLRKSTSVDESSRVVSGGETVVKDKRKGLKKIFKKMF